MYSEELTAPHNILRLYVFYPQSSFLFIFQVIFGPMFSGKSTELIRRVRRFQIAQYKCLVIKYARDTRYSKEMVATHDRTTMDSVSACQLLDVLPEARVSSVIGIDEGQFFSDIVEFCEEMANEGKTVIVAALDGTFQRKVEVIGGADKYQSVCRPCYFRKQLPAAGGKENQLLHSAMDTAPCPIGAKLPAIASPRKPLAPRN
ncbi:hypothetical protein FKM82_031174 [Ascaphus truei]